MMEISHRFARAKKLQADLFGKPFKVVQNLADDLMSEARSIKGGFGAISETVTEAQYCTISRYHLGYGFDLEANNLLENIIHYLPLT